MRPQATAFTRPDVTHAYHNTRLFLLLDAELATTQAVWIAAPAGSGKTTLLSTYLQARGVPHLWYGVDASDRDLTALFGNLAEAMRKRLGGRRKALPHLGAEYAEDQGAFARHFFTALFGPLPTPTILVLDDVHLISDEPGVPAVLAALVDVLPSGVRAVFLSRQPAPQILAHAISRQLLRTCGWGELRLRSDEADALLECVASRPLSEATRRHLTRLADGWAAGLVLLSAHPDVLPDSATGSVDSAPQVVFDFFATELLAQLDDETQALLVATSMFPRMTAGLAQSLSGQHGAGRILERLARDQLFVAKHPGRPAQYRLHPLLRHMMRQRLVDSLSLAALVEQCRRSALLLEELGDLHAAGELLIESGDGQSLQSFILRHAAEQARQGRLDTLAGWIAGVSEPGQAQEPWLAYWQGVCRLASDTVAAREHFQRAHELFVAADARTGAYLSWARIVESIILENGGYAELDHWIEELDRLRARLGTSLSLEVFVRVNVSLFNALVFRRSDSPRLREVERALRRLLLVAPEVNVRFMLGAHLVRYYNFVGDIAGATSVLGRLRAQSTSSSLAPLTRMLWVAMTSSCGWLTESAEAGIAAADDGLELAQSLGIHLFDFYFLVQGSYSAFALGRLDLAASYIERMQGTFKPERRVDVGQCVFLQGWLQLARGEFERGLASMQEAVQVAEDTRSPYVILRASHGLAQALWRVGRVDEALECLDACAAIAGPHGFTPVSYLVDLCRAEVLLSTGDRDRARIMLASALALGRRRSLQHVPHWTPRQMARLCAEALDAGIEPGYVRTLIQAFHLDPPVRSGVDASNWPWPVRIHALGRFKVLVDGEPLRFERKGQARPIELLKVLTTHGGQDVAVQRVAEALWPDADADAGRDALKTTLARLRKLIGSDAVVQVEGQLSLDRKRVWSDVQVVDEALLLILDGPKGRAGAGQDLALYCGPLLDEDDAPWVIAPRERLRDRYARAVDKLARAWLAQGRAEEALALLWRSIDAKPLVEHLYAGLMACLIELQRSAEARDVFERYRRTVLREAGRAPSRELQELVSRLA
ncbi:MAG: BTAD domain-containing putative transcriptional regulator [Pseudomonadota bacterium]